MNMHFLKLWWSLVGIALPVSVMMLCWVQNWQKDLFDQLVVIGFGLFVLVMMGLLTVSSVTGTIRKHATGVVPRATADIELKRLDNLIVYLMQGFFFGLGIASVIAGIAFYLIGYAILGTVLATITAILWYKQE